MNDYRTFVAAVVTAGSLAISLHLIQARAADEQLPIPARLAQKAGPAKGGPAATKAGAAAPGGAAIEAPSTAAESHALDLKIMQVQARLAEIDWQKAVESNKQVPGTFTAEEVQRRQETYKVAKQRYDQANGSAGKQISERLREALANAKLFEDNYKKALAANKTDANAVPPLEVERLKLLADLGRLQVAREQSTGTGQAVAANMSAGFEDLREEVQNLRRRVEELEETAK